MSCLFEKKAKDGLDSAFAIASAGRYSTSIPCAYYSAIHLMKHFLAIQGVKSYEELEVIQSNEMSHKGFIRFTADEISSLHFGRARRIRNLSLIMLRNRVHADYTLKMFDEASSMKHSEHAEEVHALIKKTIWENHNAK